MAFSTPSLKGRALRLLSQREHSRPELERKLNMSLAELELSVRATNCLESENITSVRDLVMRSEDELLEVRNLGATTLTEVKQKLVQMNMSLGMKLPAALKQRN